MKTIAMKYSCIALLFCAVTAMAQDVSLTVTADKNSAQVGEQVVITAALVSNKNLSSLSAPQIPKSDMFDVTGMDQNQSSSSSVNIINGKMTRTSTVNYMFYYGIVPKKTGTINFPALHVSAGGVNCSSQPFTILVGKPSPASGRIIRSSSISFAQ